MLEFNILSPEVTESDVDKVVAVVQEIYPVWNMLQGSAEVEQKYKLVCSI